MARTRRQKLARTLSEHAGIGYHQALTWLEEHVTGRPLPRDTAGLLAAYDAAQAQPDPVAEDGQSRATAEPTLVPVGDPQPAMVFAMRHSDLARCPRLVMSVGHYLPTGECAHQEPACPTCRGLGRLLADDGTDVPCAVRTPGLTRGVPVCDGTGRWSGAHCENELAR